MGQHAAKECIGLATLLPGCGRGAARIPMLPGKQRCHRRDYRVGGSKGKGQSPAMSAARGESPPAACDLHS